jgi:hypothetical protein
MSDRVVWAVGSDLWLGRPSSTKYLEGSSHLHFVDTARSMALMLTDIQPRGEGANQCGQCGAYIPDEVVVTPTPHAIRAELPANQTRLDG